MIFIFLQTKNGTPTENMTRIASLSIKPVTHNSNNTLQQYRNKALEKISKVVCILRDFFFNLFHSFFYIIAVMYINCNIFVKIHCDAITNTILSLVPIRNNQDT